MTRLRNLNRTTARGRICGTPHTGGLAELVPATGDSGPGYTFNDLSFPADTGKEICGRITTWPTAGTLEAGENTGFAFSGAPDGLYFFEYQLVVDGVDIGSPARADLLVGSGDATINGTVGNAAAAGAPAGIYQGLAISAGIADAVASGSAATVAVGIGCATGDVQCAGATALIYQGALIECIAGDATATGIPAAVAVSTCARAPSGSGYFPRRDEAQARPAAIQRNYR